MPSARLALHTSRPSASGTPQYAAAESRNSAFQAADACGRARRPSRGFTGQGAGGGGLRTVRDVGACGRAQSLQVERLPVERDM